MTASSRPDEARQLVAAARRDRIALDILSRDPAAPAEIALFLAQQALEKCIKAVLAMQGVVYRRTHDLLLLESLVGQAGLRIPVEHDLLARIGPFAVEFRYLGVAVPSVSMVDAQAAVEAALLWSAASVDSADPGVAP